MKIQYFYDVVCPYSWLGYQVKLKETSLQIYYSDHSSKIAYLESNVFKCRNRLRSLPNAFRIQPSR